MKCIIHKYTKNEDERWENGKELMRIEKKYLKNTNYTNIKGKKRRMRKKEKSK